MIKIKGKTVYFRENSLDAGWINGGFFVIEPNFINYIKNDQTFLEQEPFQKATKRNEMLAINMKVFAMYGYFMIKKF